MNNLDEQIRKKLQNDDIISKKAENIFNNFFKEEINMNEENISNNSQKQKKMSNLKRFLSIAACLVVILGAGNIYASSKGYGNIFFMIKYLVTGETIETSDKDEILSDRDITISYEPIRLSKNLRIQIRNLQIKNNEAKLKLYVNEEKIEQNLEVAPLKYKVYNSKNTLLCDQKSSKTINMETIYPEELLLNNYNKDDNELILEIYQANNKKIAKININLLTKEITIEGEQEALQKISETELKEFLSIYTKLQETSKEDIEQIILSVEAILKNNVETIKTSNGNAYKAQDINKVLENCGYEPIPETYKKGELFRRKTIDNIEYIEPIKVMQPTRNTIIEITKISYCDGVYTAKFTYANVNPDESFNIDFSNVQKKEAKISFTLDNEDKLLKFHIEKYLLTEEIKDEFIEEEGITETSKIKELLLKSNIPLEYLKINKIEERNDKYLVEADFYVPTLISKDEYLKMVNSRKITLNNKEYLYKNSGEVYDIDGQRVNVDDAGYGYIHIEGEQPSYWVLKDDNGYIFCYEVGGVRNIYNHIKASYKFYLDKNTKVNNWINAVVDVKLSDYLQKEESKNIANYMSTVYLSSDNIDDLEISIDTRYYNMNVEEKTENIEQIPENIFTEALLSKSEITSILGPDEATFCIENIEKSGNDYIITANMLENQPRKVSNAEYKDLINGKEITFRNQSWKMSGEDDYYIFIKSGEDSLTVLKDNKTFGNVAGAASELRDYSNKIIKFKVSKDILIGAFFANFKYDKNGQIKAYGEKSTDEENTELINFESMSFERLMELSKGCKGTYDECIAYVKNGVVGAIKIFEK